MKQEAFRRELADLTPDVPEVFHQRVEAFLAEKVDQEVTMKESTKRALAAGGRFGSRALIFALVAALMLGTVAYAATQWGIFDSLSDLLGSQPPTADSVMAANLHQETVNGVDITIREAGYDGKTLFLQYSYRINDVTEPWGTVDRDGRLALTDADFEQLDAHQVGWWVDAFWVNGQAMDMASGSGAVDEAGAVPGEIIHTEYWRLDNIDVALAGKVEIALPIGESQSAEYRKSIFDRESGQYTLPDKGVVTFTFDASDILSRVATFTPNAETVTPDVTARVTEAAFTPLMTYITLDLKANPDSVAAYKAEHGEGAYGEDGTLYREYSGMDVYGDWIASLQLVDGNGQQVFPGYWGNNGYSNTWAEFTYPYLDAEKLPDELWLATVNGGVADMEYAIRVK